MSINVVGTPTKAQILGNQLPTNSDLGVFVTKPDGSDYLSENTYNNIKYTGSGETFADTWAVDPSTPVYLNTDKATAYAYYPWHDSYDNLTSIPITNDGTDWMYSTKVENLDNLNATAAFSLQHMMSIIRIKIERMNASDFGTISKVTIDGNGWATGATLNLKEGTVGNFTGENDQLVKTDVGSLGASALTYDHWIVPTGNTSEVTFKVTMDGKIYKKSVSNVKFVAGKVYNYKLTVSNTASLAINAVTMTDWEDEPGENVETEFMSFADMMREGFQGVTTDGVYAVKEDGTPVAYDNATDDTYSAVAFVLNGKAYQVAKADATGYDGAETVYWWYDYADVTALPDITTVDGTEGHTYGHLAGSDTPQLSRNPSEWTDGALADFNGQTNTELIIAAQGNGTTDKTLGKAVMDFRNNVTYNGGKRDWFAPSAGELAFILLKKVDINVLLSKVTGATEMNDGETGFYWSSSEYSYDEAWIVDFSSDIVTYIDKNFFGRVRLVRAI